MTDDDTYDLAVLGAGSGGMAAAKRARAAGLSVVQFERRAAGGTCVNRGCVPKKLLVHAARRGEALRTASDHGWSTGEIAFDWTSLRDRVGSEVHDLAASQKETLVDEGVTYVEAEARLVAADRLRTEDGREYRARHVVVATGSRPLVPDLDGAEHALVSDDLFTLETLPSHIAMIGGGYIAVEFACLLRRFGAEVTIFESSERILDNFEPEIVERLAARMRDDGIEIHTDAKAACIERTDDGGFALALEGGARHAGFDAIALLIGRAPNTDGIGLEDIGVELDDKGQIPVDDQGRTNVPGVYAIGDVAHALQLTPVAIESGRNVVDGIVGRAFAPIRETRVPAGVYGTPELGSVGLDEAAAERAGYAFEVRRADFEPLTEMLADAPSRLLVKLVVERATDTVLGLHACGENAAETAQLAATMIEAGLTGHDLHRAMSLHPTNAEEIVALGEPRRALDDVVGND